jgi:hypothetical protein
MTDSIIRPIEVPPKPPQKVYVIAATREQAAYFAQVNKFKPNEWNYVYSERCLMGISAGIIVILPNRANNANWPAIDRAVDLMLTRKGNVSIHYLNSDSLLHKNTNYSGTFSSNARHPYENIVD